MPVLHNNANVWFKHKMREPWKHGIIIQVEPRWYLINEEKGGVYRRNIYHIRQDNAEDRGLEC